MSKTPRTDEQILHHDNGNGHPSAFVFASFARQLETELSDKNRQLAEALAVIERKNEEFDTFLAEQQAINEIVERKSALIEQMREALKAVVSSAPPGGPLWHGSAEIEKAVAAIKAAERDRWSC